jgi:hypothetical protein
MCLMTKQCNDMDTASLLIALLRTSGIAARYVMGTIEVPIDQVMNWVGGFTDKRAALDFIASGGTPVSPVVSGGGISAAQMEHVWVEAYVDYVPYRGAVNGPGDTWIPLDASFKQYVHTQGIDVDTTIPIDVEAQFAEVENQSIINEDIPSITGLPVTTVQNQMTDFQTRLNQYLADNFSTIVTFRDLSDTLHGARKIVQKNLRILPNTLERVKVVAQSAPLSEVPHALRYKINFNLSDNLFGTVNYSAYLPAIAGKRVTLSYLPATSADAQLMSDASGIIGFPLYLVQVKPELKIEGQTVALGEPIGMGKDQSFEITFNEPTGITDKVRHIVQSGGYYAVGLNPNKVTFSYLSNRVNPWDPETAPARDDRLGELLHLVSMHYFAGLDFWGDELAKTTGIARLTHPSEGLLGLRGNANYLFGIPFKVSSVGLNIDVARIATSAVSKIGDRDTEIGFAINQGINSSILEHLVFESIFGLKAFSAAKAMELTNAQQIPIYILDSENVQRLEELVVSSEDKQDIKNLINAGRTVLIPKTNIQYFNYSGTGYIALDYQTGSGAYIISGGLNGGATVETVGDRINRALNLTLDLIGKDTRGLAVFEIYLNDIKMLLDSSPGVVDRPVTDFPDFDDATKDMLRVGENTKKLWRIPFITQRIKVGRAAIILQQLEIAVFSITLGAVP